MTQNGLIIVLLSDIEDQIGLKVDQNVENAEMWHASIIAQNDSELFQISLWSNQWKVVEKVSLRKKNVLEIT
jgi:hypothetical protein